MFEKVIRRSDMLSCVLCKDAPCTAVCSAIDPAAMLRRIWFSNEDVAAALFPDDNPCMNCAAPCEDKCIRAHKVEIKKLMTTLHEQVKPKLDIAMPEDESRLKTDICGIELENPFLLSSSVVASTYDMCDRAFAAGWAGAAFKTICSLEIHETSPRFSAVSGVNNDIIGFKNVKQLSDHSVEENMAVFRKLKAKYPHKFILASIMGQDEKDWARLARLCEENGADAIELNFSCPNMMEEGLGSDIGQSPDLVERYTRAARKGTKIPILAKLTPNVSNMNPAADAAIKGGADGVAAINTIKSVTDVNIHTYVSAPAVHGKSAVGGYSGRAIKPIALRFISEITQNPFMQGRHISGMGGIETWKDAVEFILLGAGSVQVTTAVMQYGYRIIDELKSGLNFYLADKGLNNISEIRGLGLDSLSYTTDVLERDSIVFPIFHKEKCIGCGRCIISCDDGGHQALSFDENRHPVLNGQKCVGCHLCKLVCPQNAISAARKKVYRDKKQ